MKIVFRADAATHIGSGHVIRCLTLAATLRSLGASVTFVCREEPGDLRSLIGQSGFEVKTLPPGTREWSADADATRAVLGATGHEWLIVDHYGLDRRWEHALRGCAMHIMVVDDLADRSHDCDVLLDQNLESPLHHRYESLLPAGTRRLLGPHYALVRREFAELRARALARRAGQKERLLITMGGSDPHNDTAKVLQGLYLEGDVRLPVDVVIGSSNPHRQPIEQLCRDIRFATLHVQTPRMAEIMSAADLAITAGGGTTWERCALGLPAIAVVQSPDQLPVAETIASMGGQRLLGWAKDLGPADYAHAVRSVDGPELVRMSKISADLCDGGGAGRAAAEIINWRQTVHG